MTFLVATTVLNCSNVLMKKKVIIHGFFCQNGGDAGVRCREEEIRVKSVSAATVDTPYNCTKHTITISWELHNTSSHKPSSFTVTCML